MSWSDVLSVSEVRDAVGLPPRPCLDVDGFPPRRFMVVGLGGAGHRSIAGLGLPETTVLGIDRHPHPLERSGVEFGLVLDPEVLGQGGEYQAALGHRTSLAGRAELAQLISGAEVVVVVAGVGGTMVGAAPLIARLAKEAGATIFGVFSTPVSFESDVRCDHVRRDLIRATASFDGVVTIPTFACQPDAEAAAFADARYRLAMAAVSLVGAIASSSDAHIDRSELRERLHGPCTVATGVGRGQSPHDAAAAAIRDLSLAQGGLGAARNVVVHIGAPRPPRLLEVAHTEKRLAMLLPVASVRVTWATDERVKHVYATALVAQALPAADPDREPCMAWVGPPP